MLDPARRSDQPEVWEYLYRQCLASITSTPEFTKLGKKVPLLDAMAARLPPATDERVQVRLSFASVGVIARTLLREDRCPREQVARIARRALVGEARGRRRGDGEDHTGTVHKAIMAMLYDNLYDIRGSTEGGS